MKQGSYNFPPIIAIISNLYIQRRRTVRIVLVLSLLAQTLFLSPVLSSAVMAQNPAAAESSSPAQDNAEICKQQLAGLHNLSPDPVQTCMAAQPPKAEKKRGPIRKVFRAIGSEVANDSANLLKDSIFVFSAQDIDPYTSKKPSKKPYVSYEMRIVDGSSATVTKFPDGSSRIDGSYLDGTILAPLAPRAMVIAYPNGARGKMVKEGNEVKIYRPDKTITTLKQTMSGTYEATNDQLGYLGSARPEDN